MGSRANMAEKNTNLCKNSKLKRHLRDPFTENASSEIQLRQLFKNRANFWRQENQITDISRISTASIFIQVRLRPIMLNVRSNRFLKLKKKKGNT